LTRLLWLALAGVAGTLARYGLAGGVQRVCGSAFPWGTLAVNVAGCFTAGLVWMLAETRLALPAQARTAVMIGFLGSFTTFSAYALETGHLLRDAQWARVIANVALHNGLGLAALLLGFAAARRF
jgi:CrcB protein